MTLSHFIGLTLCNLIWSLHPLMGKWLLEEFTPIQGAWLRYTTALLGYGVVVFFLRYFKKTSVSVRELLVIPSSHSDKILVLFLGSLAFCFSPLLQLRGLSSSLASENAIIVAMEPLITGMLAWVLLREKLNRLDVTAFSLSLIGFIFLAGLSNQLKTPMLSSEGFNLSQNILGNLLILVSLSGEASYTVLARRLTATYAPLSLFGTALFLGVMILSLICSLWNGVFLLPELKHFTLKSLIALLWLGPIGTAGAYLYFMFILVELPVMSVTLFLFLQPLAGAAWGYLFLGDRLSLTQKFGGALILLAVSLPTLIQIKKRSTH